MWLLGAPIEFHSGVADTWWPHKDANNYPHDSFDLTLHYRLKRAEP